jgi:hypothetical protein
LVRSGHMWSDFSDFVDGLGCIGELIVLTATVVVMAVCFKIIMWALDWGFS